jgi:HlyD family secretion protein
MINVSEFFSKAKKFLFKHKIISLLVIAVILAGGYFGYKALNPVSSETRYILSSVEKGTITTSVSGTGQVESADEKSVKTKVSGEVTYVNSNVKTGNTISKGTLIATIDNTDALNSAEDAEEALESAQITLSKLVGADESNPKNEQDAKDDLAKSYEDGYNTVSSVFLELPAIMKGLDSILYGSAFHDYQDNIVFYTYVTYTYDEDVMQYKESAEKSYKIARDSYEANFADYKNSNRYSDTKSIDSLISETYETSKNVAQAVKDAINLIQFYEDTLTRYSITVNSIADTHLTSLSSYLSKANSSISSLFSIKSTIKNNIEAVEDCADEIRTAKLNVKSKENALQNAKDALADYYVYANLTGIISTVGISSGEEISSGTSAVTIITKSKIAKVTLSESDIANVKVGQKATLTFDAIEDLSIVGEVTEVDSVGAASSGVVSYGVEIAFDADTDSIKPGMSVSAAIITNSKSDVLTVPTTTVKSNDDGTYYVQVLNETYDLTNKTNSIKGVTSATAPATKTVTIGLADDTNTEITSGLSEGDQVVVRISTSSATTTSSSSKSSSNSILNAGGGGMGGGAPPGM